MGIIAWIIVGLIAGAIAKAILPGRQGGGWFLTLILGVVGAIVGGLISNLTGIGHPNDGLLDPWTWIFAILGSIVVLLILGFIQSKTHGGANRGNVTR